MTNSSCLVCKTVWTLEKQVISELFTVGVTMLMVTLLYFTCLCWLIKNYFQFQAKHCILLWHLSYVVCLWCECTVTKRLRLGLWRFYWKVPKYLNFLCEKFDSKFLRVPIDWGLKVSGVVINYYACTVTYWLKQALRCFYWKLAEGLSVLLCFCM